MAGGDELRPSYFEVYASERLTGTLRPALRFVLEVLSVRNPSLMALAGRSDDIFAAVSAVLETSQLTKRSATIAESFYGLRRSTSFSAPRARSGRRGLSTGQVAASVFLSVFVPYAKAKLDASFAAESGGALRELIQPSARIALHGGRNASFPSSRGISQPTGMPRNVRELAALIRELGTGYNVSEHFIRWYPTCSALYEGLALVFNILYMFGHTRYFSPSLALQGLVVRRLTVREFQGHDLRGRSGGSVAPENRPALAAIASGADAVLSAAKYAFVAGIFAFRFLEYYYAAESRLPRRQAVVPPPPDALQPARGVDPSSVDSRVTCPICQRARSNPAVCVSYFDTETVSGKSPCN